MATLDDHIAQSLRESQRSGELDSAPSWGKPLDLNDGFEQTPAELRMAFKALKDAGFVPPEIETMKQIATLRQAIAADSDAPGANTLRLRVSELQQHLALRLEKLRTRGSV